MKNSRVPEVEAPSQLIDARIRELVDWARKETVASALLLFRKRQAMLGQTESLFERVTKIRTESPRAHCS